MGDAMMDAYRTRRIPLSAAIACLLLLSPALAQVPPADPTEPPPNHDAHYTDVMRARTALLSGMSPVTDATLNNPPEADWLHWRGGYDTASFSPLKDITPANAGRLTPAWSLALTPTINQITPLVHDGVMFIQSGLSLQALNATSGERLWEFTRPLPGGRNFAVRDFRTKYLGLYGETLFAPTADGHVLALNAKTGKLIWESVIIAPPDPAKPPPTTNFRLNSGPLLVKGKLIIGVSSGNTIPGGSYIVGLDAATGKQIWRFNTVARPGQPGGDSWNGVPVEERFGGGVWTSGSYDPERHLVYFGTGNTYNSGALLPKRSDEPGSNDALYTNSTLALDPDSGKLVWYYQHFNRDLWDLDWVFERTLLNLPVNGKRTDIVLASGKLAMFDVLDRESGKYLFSTGPGARKPPENWPVLVSGVEPGTGKKIIAPGQEPEFGAFKTVCPNYGERNWPTSAYDAGSSVLFIPLLESCLDFYWVPRDAEAIRKGGNDQMFSHVPFPNNDGKFGRIEAVDLKTGELLWVHRQRAPIASSLLATGGGVLFAGDFDRRFHAFDAKTGAQVWETPLPASANASPISFSAGGVQYVAVVAGSGGAGDNTSLKLTPERSPGAPQNATLHVFKLAAP
jgi:alcohol dehydrogenase (cytochrome c)